MIIDYKPYEKRTPDEQYKNILKIILEKGVRGISQQEEDALTFMVPPPMRFELENGIPLITERDLKGALKPAIGEICAFINGARTLKRLEEFGCRWWKSWATPEKCKKRGLEEGDLGPGSYGAAFHDFPTTEGTTFNQFKNLIEQIKELPHLRTHYVSPWIPQYNTRGKGKIQRVVVSPCHGWIQVRILNGKLYLVMVQRSADVPVGVPSNMIQYAALAMMLGRVTGYPPKEFIHVLLDAHIYVNQIPYVEEIISRKTRPFPTLDMDMNIEDFFAFRKDHFTLSDYNPYPPIAAIPVAV